MKKTLFLLLFLFSSSTFAQLVHPLYLEFKFGLSLPDTRGGMYVCSEHIWIADHKDGLWWADKCDGANSGSTTAGDDDLWDLCHIENASGGFFLGVGGDKGTDGLWMYPDDDGDPVLASSALSVQGWGVYAIGDYVYVGTDNGLMVYSAVYTSPQSLTYVKTVFTNTDFAKLTGMGDYIYANTTDSGTQYVNSVLVLDISSPATPVWAADYDPSTDSGGKGMRGDEFRGIFLQSDSSRVFTVSDSGYVYIIDISTPTSPTHWGYADPPPIDAPHLALSGTPGAANHPAAGVYAFKNHFMYTTADGNDEGYLFWGGTSKDSTDKTYDIDYYYDDAFAFNQPWIQGCYVLVAAHDGYKVYYMAGYNTDGMVKNSSETTWGDAAKNDVYNLIGDQRKEQQYVTGEGLPTKEFLVNIHNDGPTTQDVTITAAETIEGTKWTIKYYVGTTDITTAIKGSGYVVTDMGNASAGDSLEIKIEVDLAVGFSVPDDSVHIEIVSSGSYCASEDCQADPGADMIVAAVILEPSLPVELSAFTAEAVDQGVICKWTTESETENLGFYLDKKFGGADWLTIASYKTDDRLLGQGSTPSVSDYEYLDVDVKPNFTYEYRLADIDYNDNITYHSVRTVTVKQMPFTKVLEKFTVMPAYPNPFNPITTIKYGLDKDNQVSIEIYDIAGKLITTLLNEKQSQGWHSVIWNGTNQHGTQVAAGIYFSKISSGDEVKNTKLMLLK